MALCAATKEAICLQRLLNELRASSINKININVDNQSCIALSKNPEFHARTKHIDIQHHFVREKVACGAVDLSYCPTERMVADVFTKPLPKEKHVWCMKRLGLTQVED
jgi:KUP system potassium uptake protein